MKIPVIVAIIFGTILSRAEDNSFLFGPPLDSREDRVLGDANQLFVEETPENIVKPPGIGSCGGTFKTPTGTIASPNYPKSAYPPDINCTWAIEVEEGKVMKLKFNFMDIEVDPPECPFDGLLILDYGDIEKPDDIEGLISGGRIISNPVYPPTVIGGIRFCGNDDFDPLTSISNTVFVYFYSDRDSNGQGFVLEWEQIDTPESEYECDFEKGLCPGWVNTDTEEDVFDWMIGQGETSTPETGPLLDHTLQSPDGKYLFIEAASQLENDTAILSSPEILFAESEQLMCLEFWYHMRGSDINTLGIGYAIGDDRQLVWTKSGNQGNDWVYQTIEIEKMSTPFRVMFVGIRGAGDLGDIALDDIKLHRRACDKIGSVETTTAGLPPTDYDTTTGSFTTDYDGTTYDWSESTGAPPMYFTSTAYETTTGADETTSAIDETTTSDDVTTAADVTTTVADVTTTAVDVTTATADETTISEDYETTFHEDTTATDETTAEVTTASFYFTSEAATTESQSTTEYQTTEFEFTTASPSTTEAEQTTEQTTIEETTAMSQPTTSSSTTTPPTTTTTTLASTTVQQTTTTEITTGIEETTAESTTEGVWVVATEESTTAAEDEVEEAVTVTSARPPFKITIPPVEEEVEVKDSTTPVPSVKTTESVATTGPKLSITSTPVTTTSGAKCAANFSLWTTILSLSFMIASVYIL